VILRPYAAPGNIDQYPAVSGAGGANTDTGTKATDLSNFQTAAATAVSSSGSLLKIVYTDSNGSSQTRLINVTQIQTVV
jgi:hypothetical protein